MIDWTALEAEAAALLSRYLQFDTSNPPGHEAGAIEFLAQTLRERGFEPQVLESAPGRANLVVRLRSPGQPPAPPILLYSHADVVPANPADWSTPPFGGEIREGYVWGRGALDDKGLGIVFIQALTLLKQIGPPPQRDIILLIAADEETSGRYGVPWLLDHHLDLIQAEYVWDEGGMGLLLPPSKSVYPCVYNIGVAEKGALTLKVTALGTPGHASVPHGDSASDRLVEALTRLKKWSPPARLTEPVARMLRSLAPGQSFPRSFLFARAGSRLTWPLLRLILERDPLYASLIRTTLSLTILNSGQKSNIIPAQAEATLDIRLLPGESVEVLLDDLRAVINDGKVFLHAAETPLMSPPAPIETPFFRALAQTLGHLGSPGLVTPYLTPGATDSRYFRQAGMKAYGFMPMRLTPLELSRIHGLDERIATANLRWGMQVVYETLQKL